MSKTIKSVLALSFAVFVTACAQQEEEVYAVVDQPEPISAEPVYTGKYK